MVPTPDPLHLAVALDGTGWHPAAWREPDAQPQRLFTAGYWTELAQQAERGLLDFLTIEDGLDLQSDDRFQADSRTDRVRGRLDAVLVAARAAPATRHIGFVPTAITTHTEPFHLSKAIATLDYMSGGRAGIRVQVGARAGAAAHFGRREIPSLEANRLADPDVQQLIAGHFDEAADYVEVLRRLWDSWEDDAEIRDMVTGRRQGGHRRRYRKLHAEHRAWRLAEMRRRLGITQAEVAGRMGITRGRVSAIEHAKPGATELRTLAAYVEALGGRLEIIADFGGERLAFTEAA
jgi:alkanesulfonate monooxygenase SsuD/methylene tetrahydromethanopterin reductase-like flavin-dependent oxidoreductase (luciferase family)